MIESFKGRSVGVGDLVFAYRNLHRACWSLKAMSGPHKGRVIGHTAEVILFGCELKVSEAGRQRVLRERKKNVHAGVVGLISTWSKLAQAIGPDRGLSHDSGVRKLSYNPYAGPSFTVDGEPVGTATTVHLDIEGKAWAIGGVS